MNSRRIGRLLWALTLVLVFSGPAWGHKVTVFAWVEGNQVLGECKFSGGKRAKNAEIIVWDDRGNELLRTRTDVNGEFSYIIPQKSAMRIELIAGMGHKGEWKIPIEDLSEETGKEPSSDETQVGTTVPAAADAPAGEIPATSLTASSLGEARIEAMVERAVDKSLNKKLKPMMKILADMEDKGPSVNDVMGGLGYIFGLMGVAAYYKSRQTKS